MKTRSATQTNFCIGVILAALMALSVGATRAVADPADKYKDLPGYVNFESLGGFTNAEASVEVFLKGSLIKLAREAVRYEEPELAEILDKVQLVRVNVYPLDDEQREAVAARITKLADGLEKKGWDIAVRVREEDENVYVYTLAGPDDGIEGLVVMVVEYDRHGGRHSDHEFTFVNIVSSINPEDIGRLSRAININGVDLDDIDFDNDDDDDRSRRRNRSNRK